MILLADNPAISVHSEVFFPPHSWSMHTSHNGGKRLQTVHHFDTLDKISQASYKEKKIIADPSEISSMTMAQHQFFLHEVSSNVKNILYTWDTSVAILESFT